MNQQPSRLSETLVMVGVVMFFALFAGVIGLSLHVFGLGVGMNDVGYLLCLIIFGFLAGAFCSMLVGNFFGLIIGGLGGFIINGIIVDAYIGNGYSTGDYIISGGSLIGLVGGIIGALIAIRMDDLTLDVFSPFVKIMAVFVVIVGLFLVPRITDTSAIRSEEELLSQAMWRGNTIILPNSNNAVKYCRFVYVRSEYDNKFPLGKMKYQLSTGDASREGDSEVVFTLPKGVERSGKLTLVFDRIYKDVTRELAPMS